MDETWTRLAEKVERYWADYLLATKQAKTLYNEYCQVQKEFDDYADSVSTQLELPFP